MDLLNNRKIAVIVLAAVILIMTPLGAVRSLNKVADSVGAMFYDGVEIEDGGSKYTSQSIEELLGEKAKAALGLIAAGANYSSLSEKTDALRSARETLLAADTVSAKYAANEALNTACAELYDAVIGEEGVSAADLENAKAYADTLEKVQGSIDINRYNEEVSTYYSVTASRFPANIIAKYVTPPEYFGVST